MGAKGPYLLAYGKFRKKFSTKAAIKRHYKELKDRNVGTTLHGVDRHAVCALFYDHPLVKWGQHSHGEGSVEFIVDDISVRVNQTGNPAFFFSGKDLSYVKQIDYLGRPDRAKINRIRNLKDACRKEIQYQVERVKKLAPDHQIDHLYFFNHMVFDWLALNSFRINEIETTDCFPRSFVCPDIKQSWCKYHEDFAVLRSIPARDNQARQPPHIDWDMVY